jgi:Mce-associated membrane protein
MAKHVGTPGELKTLDEAETELSPTDSDSDLSEDRDRSSDRGDDDGVDDPRTEADIDDLDGPGSKTRPRWRRILPSLTVVNQALVTGLVVLITLAGLVGWLGFQSFKANNVERNRELMLQVGRQGAVNLTTVDFANADTDVQRILDSATGRFYDEFSARSQSFVDLVKKTQSKSVGSVTEAGIESATASDARVLVAVTVNTSNSAAAEQEPRHWRMRVSVEKLGDQAKVSNVEFVP